MNEENNTKLAKLSTFSQNPQLAIFDELQEANGYLRVISQKEFPEIHPFPEIPEQKETDMTETNVLLQKLLDKEDSESEPMDISVTLKIV